MKTLLLICLIFLVSCSSTKEKSSSVNVDTISNDSFKKDIPLKTSEVVDYYKGNAKVMSSALEDETLNRYSPEELKQISIADDPLTQMAINCSQGNFEKSFTLASSIFNKYQKIPSYWNQIANCHLTKGSYRKALLFYNKALEVSPNYVPALNNIGVLYSRQNQDQKALIAFERASKESRFSKTPRYNLGRLYLIYGLASEARPVLSGLLNEAPQDIDLLNLMAGTYFLMSDYQRALSFYQKIPESFWPNPEIGLNLSWTLKKLGQNENALKVFNNVKSPSQSDLQKYYLIVKAQLGEK